MNKEEIEGKRVAIYCRTVTENHQGIQNQVKELASAVKETKGFVVNIFCDCGVSANITDRPALNGIIKAVQAGAIDTVVAYDWTRIARSVPVYLKIRQELPSCYFLQETPEEKLLSGLADLFANFEQIKVRESVAKSNDIKEHRNSQQRVVYGYTRCLNCKAIAKVSSVDRTRR